MRARAEERRRGAAPSGEMPGELRARILLVDDDRVDREAVRRLLARVPGQVEVAEADGVLSAIEVLTGGWYDCVVLDYNLPDGDGLTFLRGLRAAGIHVPVVMLTGQDDVQVAQELVGAGAACYIPKAGLTPALLLRCITEAIGTRPREAQDAAPAPA
ncbi:MAG TPA: response regulator [Longimicrobium sp.]